MHPHSHLQVEGKAKVGKVEHPLDSKNGQAIHMNSPPYAPVCLQAFLGISENMHNARICAQLKLQILNWPGIGGRLESHWLALWNKIWFPELES